MLQVANEPELGHFHARYAKTWGYNLILGARLLSCRHEEQTHLCVETCQYKEMARRPGRFPMEWRVVQLSGGWQCN